MIRRAGLLVGALAALTVVTVAGAPGASAAERPPLGDAATYAVVADQSVSSTGPTSVNGDLAIAASSSLSGFPPGVISGATHLEDATAIEVAGDTAAVNQDLRSQPCNSDRTGQDQAGLRLGAAVYCYTTAATLDGELRFDALQVPDSVWVIQVDGDYDVGAGSAMILANGAQACNVFWQVSGTITVGDGTSLVGTFVTDESIVLGEGASLRGQLFAPQGGITLDGNTITQTACAGGTEPPTTTATTTTPPTTTPPTTDTTPSTTVPTTPGPTVPGGDAPGGDTGDGSGTGSGTSSGTGTGTGSGTGGLAMTGPVSMALALVATLALGAGNALVGTERVARWNARRWRPRHAKPRFERLRRRLR